jgi:hypothetical protein
MALGHAIDDLEAAMAAADRGETPAQIAPENPDFSGSSQEQLANPLSREPQAGPLATVGPER